MKWLGIDSYFLGSLLSYLIEMKLPNNAKANLSLLWSEIVVQYKELNVPTRFSCITKNMIQAGKNPFPHLRGKASEVKWLIPVLVKVVEKYLNDNAFEKLIYKGLLLSWAIDQCLNDNMSLPRSKGWGEAQHDDVNESLPTSNMRFPLGWVPSCQKCLQPWFSHHMSDFTWSEMLGLEKASL